MEHKNFLSIDWGQAKIGVALAHAETRIAVPYAIWPVDDHLWPLLTETLAVENIGTVVFGDPEHVVIEADEKREQFYQKLCQLDVAVVHFNEMFTTKMAQANLKETQKKAISAYDDAEAARIMLTDWLSLPE